MSIKDMHAVRKWYAHLEEACRKAGRPATAGQVAAVAGTSRTTAVKYLRGLLSIGKIEEYEGTHVNGQPMTGYKPEGGW